MVVGLFGKFTGYLKPAFTTEYSRFLYPKYFFVFFLNILFDLVLKHLNILKKKLYLKNKYKKLMNILKTKIKYFLKEHIGYLNKNLPNIKKFNKLERTGHSKKYKNKKILIATSWAQSGRSIPCYGTTHADYYPKEIPITNLLGRKNIKINYEEEIGNAILKKLKINPSDIPGILIANHGVLSW